MYCRFCGTEINEQANFCRICGKQQNATKKASTGSAGLYYIIGVLFILGGILPYLLQGDQSAYSAFLSSVYSKYSVDTISACSFLTHFASFLSPLFYFSSSLIAFYTGLVFIKKEAKPIVPVIICAASHILSILYFCVINLMLSVFPGTVISWFDKNPSTIAAGEELLKNEPDLLYFYQDIGLCRMIVSAVLIALAVTFIILHKQQKAAVPAQSRKIFSAGSIVMVLSVSLLSVVGSALTIFLTNRYIGNLAVAANSVATGAFHQNIRAIVIFAFIFIIGIAVIFSQAKRWLVAIPTVGIVAALGLVALLLCNVFIEDMNPPAELFSMAAHRFAGFIISAVFILIALFFWFSSVSGSKMPLWLQVVFPLSLPVIYSITEVFFVAVLHFNSGISFGIICISVITIVMSLFIRKKDANS